MNFYRFIIGSLIFVLQVACSSTQTTTTWSDTAGKHHFQKVAVLGVIGKPSAKISFETEVAQQLEKQGIEAVAAHRLIPPTWKNAKVDQMIKKLYTEGVDVVLVISLSDVARSRSYVPGTTYVQPRTYYNRFGDYYAHSFRRVYTPGYVRRTTTLYLESTVYDLENRQLLWASASKSTNPVNLEGASRSYAKSIVKSLEKEQII